MSKYSRDVKRFLLPFLKSNNDAIRGKDGTTEAFKYADQPDRIDDIPGAKEEQTKSVTVTQNGTTTVTPDTGKVLSSVGVTVNVPTVGPFVGVSFGSINAPIDTNTQTSPEATLDVPPGDGPYIVTFTGLSGLGVTRVDVFSNGQKIGDSEIGEYTQDLTVFLGRNKSVGLVTTSGSHAPSANGKVYGVY